MIGWANPPASVLFNLTSNTDGNIVIKFTWEPPKYTGGESTLFYRVVYRDLEK